MKAMTFAAAALAVLATPTFAGGPTVMADDPMPTAAPAPAPVADWTGFYVGLSYGRSSGDLDFVPAPAQALDSGKARSIYFGHLWQRNNLVFGGEVAFTNLKDNFVTGFPCCEVDKSLDLKGRAGFAANRALIYGVLGYSLGSYDEGVGNWDPSGFSYGLGVDVMATQRLTVGVEYLSRNLNGDNPNGLGKEFDVDLDTLSLRVGLKF
jgi:outer membrane immunogenic protein